MDQKCKLLFAFPVLRKAEMSAEYLSSPKEIITGVKLGEKRSVMVTLGIYAITEKPVNIYCSVNLPGKEEPVEKAKNDSFYENLRAHFLADGNGVFLLTLEVKNVHFEKDGIYEVIVRVYPSDQTPSEETEIDHIRNYFYVLTSKGS